MTEQVDSTTAEERPAADDAGAVLARLGPAAALGIVWTMLPMILGLTLIVRYRGDVAVWLQGHQDIGIAIYIAGFALTAGLGLLPTWVQGVIGGYAFGLVAGFPGALCGFAGAAVLGYAVARLVARDRVDAEIHRHPKAWAIRQALVEQSPGRTLGIVTLVRMPPNSPFSLTNLVLASVEVPLATYMVGTLVGMAPRTLAYVWIGTQVSDWDNVSKPTWLFVGGLVLTVIAVMVIAHVGNKALERMTGRETGAAGADAPPAEGES